MTPELDPYLLEHLRKALCEDDRVGETNIRMSSAGGRIWLTGQVGSVERLRAAESVAHEIAPGIPIKNDLTVLVVTGPTVETFGSE